MANMHELLGLAIEARADEVKAATAKWEDECESHYKTVQLLGDLKAGRVLLSQLEVEGRSWSVKALPKVQVIEETTVNEPANRMASVLNGEMIQG